MAGTRPTSLFGPAATTYGTYVAAAVLSLVNVLVIARALGADGRGAVAFLIAVAILSAQVGSLGVEEANANLGGAEPELRAALATNSALLALVLGAATAAAVAALVAVVPAVGGEVDPTLLRLSLASIPLVLARMYFNLLVQADYRFRVTNLAWIIGPATGVVANSLAAALGVITVGWAFGVWIVGQALGAALLIGSVARGAGFGRPDLGVGGRALGFGLKTHVSRLTDVGNYRADQWLVGAISGTRELGLYSVAAALNDVLFHLPGVLVLVQRPDLVREQTAWAARRAARVFRVAVVLVFVTGLGLALAAPILCIGLFGSEFAGSVPQLRVLTFAAVGITAFQVLGNALTAQRKPLLRAIAGGIALTVTIVLDLALIPRYGGLGAAIATTAAWSAGGAAAGVIFVRALGARGGDLVPRRADIAWLLRKARHTVANGREVVQ